MTTDEFITRLEGVRRTSRGFIARCPAHPDRNPSLSVCDGESGVLLHCWSGCTVKEIVAALGLRLADLFYSATTAEPGRKRLPLIPCVDQNRIAFELRLHGDLLYLRAQAVLDAAIGIDTAQWGDADFDRATLAVADAYDDVARAQVLDDVAFRLRNNQLKRRKGRALNHAA